MSVCVLDRNLLYLIFDWLDRVSLGRVSRTCRVFNQVANGNNFVLWKKFVLWHREKVERRHMNYDVYNWKTLLRADRIELLMRIQKNDQMFVSPDYNTVRVTAYVGDSLCNIFVDHPTVITFILKQSSTAIMMKKGYILIYNSNDIDLCGIFANLITNYGFYQVFK